MQVIAIPITTDGDGDFVGTKVVKSPGLLRLAQWVDGDLADGVGAVLTCTQFSPRTAEVTLLTLTAANDDAIYYPLAAAHDDTGAAITGVYVPPLVHGTLTLTVSGGGDTKSGSLWLYLED